MMTMMRMGYVGEPRVGRSESYVTSSERPHPQPGFDDNHHDHDRDYDCDDNRISVISNHPTFNGDHRDDNDDREITLPFHVSLFLDLFYRISFGLESLLKIHFIEFY